MSKVRVWAVYSNGIHYQVFRSKCYDKGVYILDCYYIITPRNGYQILLMY